MDIQTALKLEIQNTGMTPPDFFESGKLIRFSDNGNRNKNGWCVLNINPDGSAGAAYGNWKDIDKKWFYAPGGKILSAKQQQQHIAHIVKAKEKAEQKQKENHAKAAKKANDIWDNAGHVDVEHGYLLKKQIEPYRLKQSGQALIIPVYDSHDKIISLQHILPDGIKKFMPGGRIKGGYFTIGNMDSDTFYICEGFSTGASIHKAINKPVVLSFSSGNLKEIAVMFREKYPDKKIIICADNDLKTEQKTGVNTGIETATEAAVYINADLCICPVNSDFNDLMVDQGMPAIRQALKQTNKINDEGWEKPVSLKEDTAPALDPELLPGIIGAMAKAVSIDTETPLELAAGLILSVMGTACHGKFKVQIKPGYQEPVNIWTVTALDSGNRKSSVLIKTTNPLTQYENNKHNELEPLIREAASKRSNQESRIKSLRAQYGKAPQENLKEIESEIFEIEKNLEEVPSYPKAWAQDVTPEHLGTLLNDHDEKMSILSAEGGIFDIIGGRYSNGVANLDLFLQGHSGDPVRVDRGSRKPVNLQNPALTLGLSPQPEVLKGLVEKKGFRGRGLLARFLYLLPKSNLGYRGLDSEPVPENIKINYQNLIFQLLDIEPGEDENGKRIPYVLNLSKEAYQEWFDFSMVVEKDLREGGRFEYINDWAGKLPGAAARIAGLLHCAKIPMQPWTKTIDFETMVKALEIASIFAEHALIAFDMMGADKSLEQAKKIWRWIERSRYESFTKRDCFNELRGTFHRVVNMDEGFKALIERNYIQEFQLKTGGRPSIQFSVNPEIIKRWL